ncbi:hypothetical protein [Reinekea sp. G2M2-21]|uniref:hypothetical protein n=1 Tax=Reinekea sp. G2M2-21 TaxID=2788942 RepID=UPI0018AA742D|nr:hypothetical protein [Reinekea sp. G2M2-21]
MSNLSNTAVDKEIRLLEQKLQEAKRKKEEQIAQSKPSNLLSAKDARSLLSKFIVPALKKGIKELEISSTVKIEDVLLVARPEIVLDLMDKLDPELFNHADDYFTATYRLKHSLKDKEAEAREVAGSIDTGVYVVPGSDSPLEKSKIESNEFSAAVCKHGVKKMRGFRDAKLSDELLEAKREINRRATKRRFKSSE